MIIMTKCKKCNSTIHGTFHRCPNCRAPSNTGMLSITSKTTSLDREVSNHLARSISASLLERVDNLNNLDYEIERKTINSLTTKDLADAISNLEGKITFDLDKLEKCLDFYPEKVALEGFKIAGLLNEKGNDLEILKKGLVFLKHKKYAEAVEWWTLNRQRLDTEQQKLQFLLLIMEVFTYTLACDELKADQVRQKIFNHPLYKKYNKK